MEQERRVSQRCELYGCKCAVHPPYTRGHVYKNGPSFIQRAGPQGPLAPIHNLGQCFCFEEQSDSVASGPAVFAPSYELLPKPCGSAHAGTKRSEEGTGPAIATEKGRPQPLLLRWRVISPTTAPRKRKKGAVLVREQQYGLYTKMACLKKLSFYLALL